ncbi:MAG: phosphate ABC transporter substrate-binding protein, partial [Caldicoprobacter oshimai]
MKRTVTLFMYAIFIVAILAGCGAQGNNSDSAKNGNEFDISREIHVISREEGSGTRGAFVELFGIQQKDSS